VASTRKLIRNTWLTLKVSDVPKVAQQVRQIAEQLNGYIAHAAQSRSPDGTWHATMTVRVPSDRYFEALSRLQQLGQVDDLREQVQDVTEEFVDLQARVRVLKRSEERLMELLKRSGKISELMQVERELAQRRSEIEMLEGRLRYLTHQTTFSTIQVTLVSRSPRARKSLQCRQNFRRCFQVGRPHLAGRVGRRHLGACLRHLLASALAAGSLVGEKGVGSHERYRHQRKPVIATAKDIL
jgi:hypothetical protein